MHIEHCSKVKLAGAIFRSNCKLTKHNKNMLNAANTRNMARNHGHDYSTSLSICISLIHNPLKYDFGSKYDFAKSEKLVGRLQFVSIAGCRTRSVEIYRVMFAWCKLLSILHFRLFLVAIVRYSYIELNRQIPYELNSVQILKMQNSHQLKSSQHYAKYFVRL
jgi:hypothetical protein